jgi:hypothetical protein
VRDHLAAFANNSQHRVCFVDCRTCPGLDIDLNQFDCVVFHYSIVISSSNYLVESFAERLRQYGGYKVLFIQDEYRFVNRTVDAVARLGVDIIYSVLNEDVRDRIYHHASIRNVRRKTTLTGFVPEHLLSLQVLGYDKRPIDVGYRARRLFASLGATGQEKWQIGERFTEDAKPYDLRCDIEYEEGRRLYGQKWISFIMNCKAVLGTESCVSFIDFDGTVMPKVDAYELAHPEESIADIQTKFLGDRDGELAIRVISPRCFEAAALRTLMILYPGRFSGILEAWRHYVPLERDHSNIAEVIAVLRDPVRAQSIVDNAYNEIALNPKYWFRAMVEEFDQDLDTYARAKARRALEQIEGQKLAPRDANRLMASYQRRSTVQFMKRDFLWLRPRLAVHALVNNFIRTVVPPRFRGAAWLAVGGIAHPKQGCAMVMHWGFRTLVPMPYRPAVSGWFRSLRGTARLAVWSIAHPKHGGVMMMHWSIRTFVPTQHQLAVRGWFKSMGGQLGLLKKLRQQDSERQEA